MIYSITPGDDPPVVLVAGLGFGGASWRPVLEQLGSGCATLTYDRPATGDAPPRPASPQSGPSQPGLSQPGLSQPGLSQPGLSQPGLSQPGSSQPGSSQPGSSQPGSSQPGPAQPGAAPPGSPQPGSARPIGYGVLADELVDVLAASGVDRPAVLVGHSMGASVVRVLAGRHPERVAGLVFVDASLPRLALPGIDESSTDGDGPGASPIDMLTGEVEVLRSVLPTVPAVVLARTPGWWPREPIPHPALDELWHLHQRGLATDRRAPLLIAKDAGHLLPEEAPALVAYSIDLVVRAVRSGRAPAPDEAELAAVGGRLG